MIEAMDGQKRSKASGFRQSSSLCAAAFCLALAAGIRQSSSLCAAAFCLALVVGCYPLSEPLYL